MYATQSRTSRSRNNERSHFGFSMKLKRPVGNCNYIITLVENWLKYFDSEGKRDRINSKNVSGTYNSLSKMSILGNKWSKDQQKSFKSLIVKLAEKGKGIYEDFDSRDIANTFNALSKWDVFNDSLWKDDNNSLRKNYKKKFKDLIVNLAKQGKAIYTEFNSQEIANTSNALSKWDVFNDSRWEDNRKMFKDLVVNLAKQGNEIYTEFNSQEIANTFNALSKWDVFHDSRWKDNRKMFKDLIVNLAQRKKVYTKFNSQEIANTFNALSKWDVFHDSRWKDNRKMFKDLVVNLAKQGNEIYTEFNSQEIANTFNALSKWDVFHDSRWKDNRKMFKDLIVNLAKQGNEIYTEFNSQEIANTFNALSKWDVLDSEVWDGEVTIDNKQVDKVTLFKTLIVKLVDQGIQSSTQFNSQEIANTFNALSKWDVLDSEVWDGEVTIDNKQVDKVTLFKTLIVKLVDQGIQSSTQFNSQAIANILNALSKLDVFNDERWKKDEQNKFKNLIVKLTEQGQNKEFNSQAIANILNALSKLDVFNDERWKKDEQNKFKNLIVKLTEQGQNKEFNSQEIANILNALSKLDVLDSEVWDGEVTIDNKQVGDVTLFKSLIVNLAKQGNEIYTEFDSQHIANTFNALSKWDVLNSKIWTGKVQIKKGKEVTKVQLSKDFIVKLAEKGNEIYTEFNSQAIANTFNALSKWDVFNDLLWTKDEQKEFKSLITNLANQAITIIQTQHQQFDIRAVSSIICDLPKLKVPTEFPSRELLTSLMKHLGADEYCSKYSDKDWSTYAHNIVLSLDGFANVITSELVSDKDKQSLLSNRDFNKDLSRTLNKLSRLNLNTYRTLLVLKGVSRITEVIKDKDALTEPFGKLFKKLPFSKLSVNNVENAFNSISGLPDELLKSLYSKGYLDHFLKKINQERKNKLIARAGRQEEQILLQKVAGEHDWKITEDNMIIDETTPIKYTLEEFKQKLKEEKEIEYKPGIEVKNKDGPYYKHNVEKGNPRIWIAPVAAIEGEKNWGIFAENEIEIGTFLGTYAGERIRVVQSGTSKSLYTLDITKSMLIDGGKKRNWAGYINHGPISTANVDSFYDKMGSTKQAVFNTREKVSSGSQLLFDYGENYLHNLDYALVYLHPTDNNKTPSQHYNSEKDAYHNYVIEIDKEIAQDLGYNGKKYFVVSKSFQSILTNGKTSEGLNTPIYAVNLNKGKKWEFDGYNEQQQVTSLMFACYLGEKDPVEFLLSQSDIDITRNALHSGHSALFFTVLSDKSDSEDKKKILERLITKVKDLYNQRMEKLISKYVEYKEKEKREGFLKQDISRLLYISDDSGKNLFDHMMGKGEYSLYKTYYKECHKDWQKKIARKYITEEGIFNIILNLDSKEHIEVIDLLLENISAGVIKEYFEDYLEDIEQDRENINYKEMFVDFSGDKEKKLGKLKELELIKKLKGTKLGDDVEKEREMVKEMVKILEKIYGPLTSKERKPEDKLVKLLGNILDKGSRKVCDKTDTSNELGLSNQSCDAGNGEVHKKQGTVKQVGSSVRATEPQQTRVSRENEIPQELRYSSKKRRETECYSSSRQEVLLQSDENTDSSQSKRPRIDMKEVEIDRGVKSKLGKRKMDQSDKDTGLSKEEKIGVKKGVEEVKEKSEKEMEVKVEKEVEEEHQGVMEESQWSVGIHLGSSGNVEKHPNQQSQSRKRKLNRDDVESKYARLCDESPYTLDNKKLEEEITKLRVKERVNIGLVRKLIKKFRKADEKDKRKAIKRLFWIVLEAGCNNNTWEEVWSEAKGLEKEVLEGNYCYSIKCAINNDNTESLKWILEKSNQSDFKTMFKEGFIHAATWNRVESLEKLLQETEKRNLSPFSMLKVAFQETIKWHDKPDNNGKPWNSTTALKFLWEKFNDTEKENVCESLDSVSKEKLGSLSFFQPQVQLSTEEGEIGVGVDRIKLGNSAKKRSKSAAHPSKKRKANTGVSLECSDGERQEVFLRLSEFVLNNFPNASIKSVRQGLHLPSFEKRGVKVNGKCVAITRGLSQALFLQSDKSFLSNLETSAEIYERIAQGKQVSKREEREVFAFSRLLNNFERQLDSATNSLSSSLIHTRGYKTLGDLSSYISGVKGDFAIHLVTSNHVVAIYRTGDNYAYFDSNTALVSGLKSVDQLMKVVEKAVESAGYKVEEKGFLVEHFDVEQANKLLSSGDRQVLAKEIKTERQLLAEQDKEFGLIKINGQELSRVQLYDFGTKINVEGSAPLLINADMNLSSKKFQDYLDKKEVSMTAREYLDNLKNSKNVEEVVQATKLIPFMGSKREVEKAEQTRKPLLEQLVKGTINSILAAVSLVNISRSESQLPGKADDKPRTCLNDPTADKQLQRSCQTISS